MHITTAKLQIRFRLIAICYLSSCIFYYPQLLSFFGRTSAFSFWHQKYIMANFRESIDALKAAGLADSEILEIMSESVDGQMLTKNSSFIKESGHELPTKNNDTTAETPSVHKRKADTLRTEKQSKTIRQGSPGQHRMEIIPLLTI